MVQAQGFRVLRNVTLTAEDQMGKNMGHGMETVDIWGSKAIQ